MCRQQHVDTYIEIVPSFIMQDFFHVFQYETLSLQLHIVLELVCRPTVQPIQSYSDSQIRQLHRYWHCWTTSVATNDDKDAE